MPSLKQATEISLLHHALSGVAEEMGEALKRTAYSPNIKERQDYSCAVFDADGRLLAQAAHLPVHLGSMPASVEAVIRSCDLQYDDYAVVNDPYNGGTHLPDITMVRPVYSEPDRMLLGYVANRAHHADVGGAAPGSMSPQTDLNAEGFVIPPSIIERDGCMTDLWQLILANTRTPVEREGDLWAQFAACDRGYWRLSEVIERIGFKQFKTQCAALLHHSTELMADTLKRLKQGVYKASDVMESDGAGNGPFHIRLSLTIKDAQLKFDFSASDPQAVGGINAVKAVTQSAVYYSALCLCEDTPPINEGCFLDIEIVTQAGTIVDARRPAPVAGGNVETSQRIVDVCFQALAKAGAKISAGSQGTMNNLTIGGIDDYGKAFTYYETIAGGCGAGPTLDGSSATHSHMTNTLNTPIEALEHAYPLRVEEYSIRAGSGGDGKQLGGDGIVRRIRALVPCKYGLLTERRETEPKGIKQGENGRPGINQVLCTDGQVEPLESKTSGQLEADESIDIRTPGGAGYGKKKDSAK
ncbi:MAG: hydantoinase B/oxoprolinase family protein [Planctomycetes bacterium]|nr:hydantoinase B/oxoprolinase family protein [Planctomycetota bacterium]